MKFFIFLAGLLALGQATDFKVMKGNETCIKVAVSGSFEYVAEVDGTKMSKSLDLKNAKFMEKTSTCSSLKLIFEPEDVQVWFDFENTTDKQIISLVSAFTPSDVFNTSNNDSLVFKAGSAFQSPKNQSYKCVSEVSTPLEGKSPKDINITVMAVLKNFQAQSSDIKGDKFSEATECSQDETTTSPPTTQPPTTQPPTTQPPPVNSYSVHSGNVTCINMTGTIAFAITYETKTGNFNTSVIEIPHDYSVGGNCKYENSSAMQSIEIKFFENSWYTSMVFTEKDGSYHISQINFTYVFDENLPNAHLSGQSESVVSSLGSDFLKAKVEGYYLCNSNVTQELNGNVTLSTKDFKYQAFNTKATAEFDSKDVAECSQDEDSNSIVPIAVGAALAGLVVIVLIAYLIGRRRSKKSGYESV